MKKMFLFSAIIIAIVFMSSCEKTKNIVSEPIDEWNRADLINNCITNVMSIPNHFQ